MRKTAMKKGIKYRLVVNFGIIICLIVIVFEMLFLISVQKYYYGNASETLNRQAQMAASYYNRYAAFPSLKEKARYIFENRVGDKFSFVEVIDRQRNVLLNSYGFSGGVHENTPDISAAFKGEVHVWRGKDPETGESIIAVSRPLKTEDRIIGVLRYAVSAEQLDSTVARITAIALITGGLVIAVSFALSHVLAKRMVQPIKELTAVAEQMARGNFQAKASRVRDDEIGILADTFNYMSREIAKTEELKNDFISSVSHELRTPLTSIKGWGETLLSGDLNDREELQSGLSVISRETERLTELVEDLLDFSKLQSRKMNLRMERLDLNRVVEDVREQFSFKNEEKAIRLTVRREEEPLEIEGDSDRITQVLVNLVHNAIKYTPSGGKVEITTRRRKEEACVEVDDTGMGIPSEELSRITEKFYKGKSNQSGSGLGLSISKEIVQLHGGRLDIWSDPGTGTRVTVRFPLGPKGERSA
ncbi:sensor histidine kinase [Paludifilum halophilum]|nr:ATP-binding protein [Paludifilum halophilum]